MDFDNPYRDHQFQQVQQSLPDLGSRSPSLRQPLKGVDQKALANSLLYMLDWGQTSNIAANPNIYHETNPVLGKHPSQGDVNKYFLSILMAHGLINAIAPDKLRDQYNDLAGRVQGATVQRNAGIGLSLGARKR